MEKPSAAKAPKVPISEIGTTRIGISVARQLCRNRYTTNTTSTKAMARVLTTSLRDSVTNGVVLYGIVYTMPAGNRGAWSSMTSLICLATLSALASGCRNIPISAAGMSSLAPLIE
jgi:hypothetical protein